MAEYRLANGEVLTDEDIDQICREFESESWAGRLRRIHQGPAAISDDPLVTVTVKIPRSRVEAIDGWAQNRSDFFRRAIVAARWAQARPYLIQPAGADAACARGKGPPPHEMMTV